MKEETRKAPIEPGAARRRGAHGRRAERLRRWGGRLLSLGALVAAVLVARGELRKYPPHDIARELARLGPAKVAIAVGLTALCYWVMTAYDYLGFRYVKERIGYGRVTFAAFLAFAFGNSIGLANLGGAAVRYRVYSRWRIPAVAVTEVIALDVFSNWMGFFLANGAVFLLASPRLPDAVPSPLHDTRVIGALFLALPTCYVLVGLLRRAPLRIGRWKLPSPRSRLFWLQVVVGCLEFVLGGLPLYVLMPSVPHVGYGAFLGMYLLALAVGLISHVPGALGVFESLCLMTMTAYYPGAAVIGALIAYRVIYFLLPLALAMALFAIFELVGRRAIRSAERDRSIPSPTA